MPDGQNQPGFTYDYFPGPLPCFTPGQIVIHRRYGYRGVIVDFDMSCHADEQWYQSNQTQPSRDQPWYHILVDGSRINTYVAEQNLAPDNSPAPIDHPLVDVFLDRTAHAGYQRNDQPWPT